MAATNGSAPEKTAENVQELGRELYKMADDARKEAIKQLNEVAALVRERSQDITGDARQQADRIAKNLEKTASKLSANAVDQISEAEETARETVESNPWQTVILALIIGLVIGWLLSRD